MAVPLGVVLWKVLITVILLDQRPPHPQQAREKEKNMQHCLLCGV